MGAEDVHQVLVLPVQVAHDAHLLSGWHVEAHNVGQRAQLLDVGVEQLLDGRPVQQLTLAEARHHLEYVGLP